LVPDSEDGGDEGENEKCREKLGFTRRKYEWRRREEEELCRNKGRGGKKE